MIILNHVSQKIGKWRQLRNGAEVAPAWVVYKTVQGFEKRWYWLVHQFGDDQIYYVPMMAQTILTASPGTQQTLTSDATWNNSANTVEALGGGGSGAACGGVVLPCPGGSGAAYSKITNFTFASPGSTTAGYQIGIGGASVNQNTTGQAGNNGGHTWFNNTAFATGTDNTQCNAAQGIGGTAPNTAGVLGPAGGSTGWGQTINAGGKGGDAPGATTKIQGAGGGGAAGPNGAGNQGVDVPIGNSNAGTAGGQGDVTFGGAAGAPGAAGGNGTEWDATHGSGGGGGGAGAGNSNTVTAGGGGNYGAAGAGASNGKTSGGTHNGVSGAGTQGLIVLTWTPAAGPAPTGNTLPLMGVA